ncbi:homeobox protein NANOG [Phascolarctos cinereus]|uniref:Homeobox protein NANOG n=1 Tax=Phascolarctos cinereus TaxID=38626 RepID=A0A6P5KYX4_PHACI|nr:homeobox protein NANOG [Phascolarctos cinereus]
MTSSSHSQQCQSCRPEGDANCPYNTWISASQPEPFTSPSPYSNFQIQSPEKLQPSSTAISPAPPSSMDMFIQDIPDSATSPTSNNLSSQNKPKIHQGKEDQSLVKKPKMRTVFSQAQLNVLNSRFVEQKYLSPQQIRNVAENLNLTYKQVKTWFQNQRMKSKRWQKDTMWSKNGSSMGMVQNGSAVGDYISFYSPFHQDYMMNPSGNLPVWGNQTWNNQFQNVGEGAYQHQMFQHPYPASDLGPTFGNSSSEVYSMKPQTTMSFNAPHTVEYLPNYSMNMQLTHSKSEEDYDYRQASDAQTQFLDPSGVPIFQS